MTHATGDSRRHVPVRISADTSHLTEDDRLALPYLVQAVKLIDSVWLKQMSRQDFTVEAWAVADALEAAARFVTHRAFRNFVLGRAKALRTNSYHASDIEWVRCLGAPFELIIGPFEPSEKLDGARNSKARSELFCPINRKG